MDDEMLIKEVRPYEELYNMAHQKYKDAVHKDNIWKKIGSELKTTGTACKERWFRLRDQQRRAIKKKMKNDGQAAENKKVWKYEECMSFVIPFIGKKEGKIIPKPYSLSEYCKNKQEEPSEINGENPMKIPKQSSISPKKVSKFEESNKTETASPVAIKYLEKNDELETANNLLIMEYLVENYGQETKEIANDHPIEKYIVENDDQEMKGTANGHPIEKYIVENDNQEMKGTANGHPLETFLVENSEQETEGSANGHPVDVFFGELAAMVKTFSPEYQHMARSKLFNVVSELKWAYLLSIQSKNSNFQVLTPNFPSPDYRSNTHPIFQTQTTYQEVYPQQNVYQIAHAPNTVTSSNHSFMLEQTLTPSPISSRRLSTQSFYETFHIENL